MRLYRNVLLAAMIAPAILIADQVVLDNGDRVTGKVTKKDGDSVTIASDLMGPVTIKWAHVKSVATDAPVTVVLKDGKEVEGKLTTSGDQVEVAGQTAPLPSVTTVRNAAEEARHKRFLHPPIYDLWAGYYDFGIADASGNSRALSITNSLNAARETSNDKISIYANQIYSKGLVGSTVGLTADALRGGWKYDRNVSKRMFLSVFDDYEKDKFQNLTFRGVFGGGAGFHAVKSDRAQLDLAGGFSLDHESYSVAIAPPSHSMTRNAGEVYWGDDFLYKINKASAFTQSFRMFNNVSDTGQYRMNFDIGTVTKIAKWFSWQITASDRYITNPAPGRKTNDLLISSGIRVTFSQLPQ
jgi:putative salt-induced outer membrane protein YdiY